MKPVCQSSSSPAHGTLLIPPHVGLLLPSPSLTCSRLKFWYQLESLGGPIARKPESPWVRPRHCWDLYSPGDCSVRQRLRTSVPLTTSPPRLWQMQNLKPDPSTTETESVACQNSQVIPMQVKVWEALPNNSQVTGWKSLLSLRTGS